MVRDGQQANQIDGGDQQGTIARILASVPGGPALAQALQQRRDNRARLELIRSTIDQVG